MSDLHRTIYMPWELLKAFSEPAGLRQPEKHKLSIQAK